MNTEIKTRIKTLCAGREITTAYQLTKRAGFSPSQADRLFNDKVEGITLSVLKTLCDVLKCSPNDIFGYDVASVPESVKTQSAPVSNARDVIRRLNEATGGNVKKSDGSLVVSDKVASDNETLDYAVDDDYLLTTADVGKMLDLNPRTVRENAEKGLLLGKQGKQSRWFFRQVDVTDFLRKRGEK